MNDLVKFGGAGLPANPQDMIAALQNVGQNITASAGGIPLLRLLKSGHYAFGPENIEPQEASEWAMNPASLMHGWACWSDGELLDEVMAPFNQTPPAMSTLPDLGQPWKRQYSMQLQCLNGEDTGVVVLYKGTSVGMANAVKDLINKLIAQIQVDSSHFVPVLDLASDSYTHKKHGQIFFPVLDIVRWVGYDGGEAEVDAPDAPEVDAPDAPEEVAAADPEPEEKPASNRRGRRAAADKPNGDDSASEATPPRRRRRAQ